MSDYSHLVACLGRQCLLLSRLWFKLVKLPPDPSFSCSTMGKPQSFNSFCFPLSFLPLQSLPPSGLPRYDFIANRSWNTLYGHFPFWSVYVLRCVLSLLMGDVPLSVHSKFMLWSCFKVPCGGLWREIRPGSYTENQAGKSVLSSGVPSMAPRNVEL